MNKFGFILLILRTLGSKSQDSGCEAPSGLVGVIVMPGIENAAPERSLNAIRGKLVGKTAMFVDISDKKSCFFPFP